MIPLLLAILWQAPYAPDGLAVATINDARIGTIANCNSLPFCRDTDGNICLVIWDDDARTQPSPYCFSWPDWIIGWKTPNGPGN